MQIPLVWQWKRGSGDQEKIKWGRRREGEERKGKERKGEGRVGEKQ